MVDGHRLEHFECYLVTDLAVEFHIVEVAEDPSFLDNVHMDPFAVDYLDRADASVRAALGVQHVGDTFADANASVSDDQEYAKDASDALVGALHTLAVALAEVLYLDEDNLTSFHLEEHHGCRHYYHYLVEISFLCHQAQLMILGEVMANLFVHHSVT